MRQDLVIVRLDNARQALMEAKTIQDTKKVLDMAVAAEIYAKRQKLSQESIQYATEIKFEALDQLDKMLKATPRNKGTKGQLVSRGVIGGTKSEPPIPTLAELGLDKKTAALARQIGTLPASLKVKVKAFKANKDGWAGLYQHATQSSGSWQSECLFVPRRIVWNAIYAMAYGRHEDKKPEVKQLPML